MVHCQNYQINISAAILLLNKWNIVSCAAYILLLSYRTLVRAEAGENREFSSDLRALPCMIDRL